MRIRRRAPAASQAPDPSLQLQAPANGSQETSEHPSGGVTLAGLHPDVDLTTDPQPSCIPSQDPSLAQVVGEKEEVMEKKSKVDVDANKMGDFHVNSNNKSSTGAGRVLGERKVKAKAAINSKRSDHEVINVSSVKEEDEDQRVYKKRRIPAVLMEGSRCSRVNGRGWRCCQQTLVGYSLCEHHLGKGRLRSMSSVRGQLGTTKPVKANAEVLTEGIVASSSLTERMKKSLETSNGAEDDENPESKCKKIGMVKARSISSLLG